MVAAAAKNNKFLRNTLMVIILLKANSLIGELLDYFFFSYYYISSFVDPETVFAGVLVIHGAKSRKSLPRERPDTVWSLLSFPTGA